MIDKDVIDEYLRIIETSALDLNNFETVTIEKTDIYRFADIENGTVDSVIIPDKYQDINELSFDELKQFLSNLKREESYTNSNNGRKFITIKRLEVEKLLEKYKCDNY